MEAALCVYALILESDYRRFDFSLPDVVGVISYCEPF